MKENNKGTVQALYKSRGLGADRKSTLISYHPCSIAPSQASAKIPYTFQKAGSHFAGGETEAGGEEASVFQTGLDDSVSS